MARYNKGILIPNICATLVHSLAEVVGFNHNHRTTFTWLLPVRNVRPESVQAHTGKSKSSDIRPTKLEIYREKGPNRSLKCPLHIASENRSIWHGVVRL